MEKNLKEISESLITNINGILEAERQESITSVEAVTYIKDIIHDNFKAQEQNKFDNLQIQEVPKEGTKEYYNILEPIKVWESMKDTIINYNDLTRTNIDLEPKSATAYQITYNNILIQLEMLKGYNNERLDNIIKSLKGII